MKYEISTRQNDFYYEFTIRYAEPLTHDWSWNTARVYIKHHILVNKIKVGKCRIIKVDDSTYRMVCRKG